GVLVLDEGQDAVRQDRATPRARRRFARGDLVQQQVEDAATLADRTLCEPVHPEISADGDPRLGLGGVLEAEADGRPYVRSFRLDAPEVFRLTGITGPRHRSESGDPVPVTGTHVPLHPLVVEPLATELAE